MSSSRELGQRLADALGSKAPLPEGVEGLELYREVVRASGAEHAVAAAALTGLGIDALAVLGPSPLRSLAQQRVAAWQALKPQSAWGVGVAIAFGVGLLVGGVLGLIRLVP